MFLSVWQYPNNSLSSRARLSAHHSFVHPYRHRCPPQEVYSTNRTSEHGSFQEKKATRLPFRHGLNFSKSFLPKAAGQKGTVSRGRTRLKRRDFVFPHSLKHRPTKPSRDWWKTQPSRVIWKQRASRASGSRCFFCYGRRNTVRQKVIIRERLWRITLLMWAWEREPLTVTR